MSLQFRLAYRVGSVTTPANFLQNRLYQQHQHQQLQHHASCSFSTVTTSASSVPSSSSHMPQSYQYTCGYESAEQIEGVTQVLTGSIPSTPTKYPSARREGESTYESLHRHRSSQRQAFAQIWQQQQQNLFSSYQDQQDQQHNHHQRQQNKNKKHQAGFFSRLSGAVGVVFSMVLIGENQQQDDENEQHQEAVYPNLHEHAAPVPEALPPQASAPPQEASEAGEIPNSHNRAAPLPPSPPRSNSNPNNNNNNNNNDDDPNDPFKSFRSHFTLFNSASTSVQLAIAGVSGYLVGSVIRVVTKVTIVVVCGVTFAVYYLHAQGHDVNLDELRSQATSLLHENKQKVEGMIEQNGGWRKVAKQVENGLKTLCSTSNGVAFGVGVLYALH